MSASPSFLLGIFLCHISVSDEYFEGTACIHWGVVDQEGYGRFAIGDRSGGIKPHRWIYEQVFGPIPTNGDGEPLTIDHRCHDSATCSGGKTCLHRRCVNPFHLSPETIGDNVRRSLYKGGRPRITRNRPKAPRTHCRNGHPVGPDEPQCKTCRSINTTQSQRWLKTAPCPICGKELRRKNITSHLKKRHPESK